MNATAPENSMIGTGQDLAERIVRSELFKSYQAALMKGTGLAIDFVANDETLRMPYAGHANETRFCRLLRKGTGNAWETANALLLTEAQTVEGALKRTTVAGLLESAIPVRHGTTTVGYLRIGQALASAPEPKALSSFLEQLASKRGLYNTDALSEAYFEIPIVPLNRFSGIVDLVTVFASQLAEQVNRLMLMKRQEEPAAVTKAKQFIVDNLDESLNLKLVAKHANVSQFYLCKIFKASTGLTLTQFTGRLRIERAKQLLLKESRTVSEIALEVGFNSLSQFNRLFSRYVGQPPTKFRDAGSGGQRTPIAVDIPGDESAHALAAC